MICAGMIQHISFMAPYVGAHRRLQECTRIHDVRLPDLLRNLGVGCVHTLPRFRVSLQTPQQTSQTDACTKDQKLRTLIGCDIDRLKETLLRLAIRGGDICRQLQLTPQSAQFRFPEAFARYLCHRECLVESLEAGDRLSVHQLRLSFEGEEVWQELI